MFQGHAGLSMEGDHLDISYNRPEEWPKLTPSGSIRALIFNVGDAVVGPCFQLRLTPPVEDETRAGRLRIARPHPHARAHLRVIPTHRRILARAAPPPGAR